MVRLQRVVAVARPADSNAFECSGRIFPASEIALIREVVATCRGLSRKELANTISELVGWTRANSLRSDQTVWSAITWRVKIVVTERQDAAGSSCSSSSSVSSPSAISPRITG
jgi:hypothetical protein